MGQLKSDFVCKKRTICEVHREIYDILSDLDENEFLLGALELLDEAFGMAKKMSDKLYEYKYNVEQNSEENHNYEKSMELRKGRVHPE